jgi:hypothetical protein
MKQRAQEPLTRLNLLLGAATGSDRATTGHIQSAIRHALKSRLALALTPLELGHVARQWVKLHSAASPGVQCLHCPLQTPEMVTPLWLQAGIKRDMATYDPQQEAILLVTGLKSAITGNKRFSKGAQTRYHRAKELIECLAAQRCGPCKLSVIIL